MDKNSKISSADLKELAITGVISWVDATKAEIEQLLSVELVEIPSSRTDMSCYQILDPEIEGSNLIALYVHFESELGEPDCFCFKNDKGLTIPISTHTQEERIALHMANQSWTFYLTPIEKLTRESYLSAVENRDSPYRYVD